MDDSGLRSRVRAIIFDLDGTLYRQGPLRRAMMLRLLRAHLMHPRMGMQTLRVLAAYRQAQETLRHSRGPEAMDLATAQMGLACDRTGSNAEFVMACVDRWMHREPLVHLGRYVHAGLIDCINAAYERGVKLAVLSDYPAESKLAAIGLIDYFDVVLSAQSATIGVFKPHPRGLEVTMQSLGMVPSDCMYVGDRADVDGLAAAAAGVACFILGRDGDFDTLRQLVSRGVEAAQPVLDPA